MCAIEKENSLINNQACLFLLGQAHSCGCLKATWGPIFRNQENQITNDTAAVHAIEEGRLFADYGNDQKTSLPTLSPMIRCGCINA